MEECFEPNGDTKAAERFIKKTGLPIVAPSLGEVDTLLSLPAKTSHVGMTPKDRDELGITDGLIRMPVGIENTQDIIQDFEQALRIS